MPDAPIASAPRDSVMSTRPLPACWVNVALSSQQRPRSLSTRARAAYISCLTLAGNLPLSLAIRYACSMTLKDGALRLVFPCRSLAALAFFVASSFSFPSRSRRRATLRHSFLTAAFRHSRMSSMISGGRDTCRLATF